MIAEQHKARNCAAQQMVGKVATVIGDLGEKLRPLEEDIHYLMVTLGYGEREVRLQRHSKTGKMRVAAVDLKSGEVLNARPWREVAPEPRHPLSCECDDCLYPEPKYARLYMRTT